MGRLVGLTMVVLLVALVVQAIRGDQPVWVSVVSIPAALLGIGLAAARQLTEAMGGRITVEAQDEAGPVFAIFLPAA